MCWLSTGSAADRLAHPDSTSASISISISTPVAGTGRERIFARFPDTCGQKCVPAQCLYCGILEVQRSCRWQASERAGDGRAIRSQVSGKRANCPAIACPRQWHRIPMKPACNEPPDSARIVQTAAKKKPARWPAFGELVAALRRIPAPARRSIPSHRRTTYACCPCRIAGFRYRRSRRPWSV